MSELTSSPSVWDRLATTPMRDVIRGRLTGRLDWRRRLAAAGLPADVAARVAAVVRRTRLWPLERAAVADELIAHFADAIAAGVADPVAAFGDDRSAAKLIRRAKRRNRPLIWHAWTWAWRAGVALLLVYAALLVPVALGRPRVSVDYVARIAAPARAVPEADRAWPLWRQAILACKGPRRDDDFPPEVIEPRYDPADPAAQSAWLAAHADAMATARRAAAKPALGFVVGPGGTRSADPAMFGTSVVEPAGEPVVEVLLPALNELRGMADILAVDLRRAADRGDGTTVEADAVALHRLAGQVRRSDGFLVTQLVAIGIDEMAVDRLAAAADRPAVLADAAIVRLAHTFAGSQVAADLIDVSGERAFFADLVQRMYTDDGHGDGRLTWTGMRLLPRYCVVNGSRDDRPSDLAFAVPFAVASRATVTAAYDRLLAEATGNFDRPLRLADWRTPMARVAAWRQSAVDRVRYATLLPFMFSSVKAQVVAERYLGDRDGLEVGLALELYRRRHGAYPATLAALVPDLLPTVPADRITGDPVRYRLVAGRPVVYSVGVDRADDGGRRPAGRRTAAEWDPPAGSPPVNGDWVLYPPAE